MIGIRADANLTVATGHIMRCITIANELNKLGEDIIFITADHDADALLSGINFPFRHIVLDSMWDDLEAELPVLIESIQANSIDTLLVDSYRATYDYIKAISRVCKVAYIDDLHESIYPVDLLINYNGYFDIFDYVRDYSNIRGHSECTSRLLLGLDYAPLREQFQIEHGMTNESHSDSKNILISAGGGDMLHVMSAVLEQACEKDFFPSCNWHVIMGRFVDNREELIKLADRYPNIILHEMVTDMATLMRSCDIGITAAGTMLTECAACSLPSIYYLSADNQRYEADYWCKNDKMIYAGDMLVDKNNTIDNIIEAIENLLSNPQRLESMASVLSHTVDGHGAIRIAKELINL